MAFNEARSAKVQAFLSRQGQRFPEIKEMQERYEEENQRGRFLEQQYMENMRDQYERELVKSQIEKKRMQHQYHLEQVQTYQGNSGAASDDDAYRGEQMQPVPPPPQSSRPYHHAPQLSSESMIRQDQHAEMLIDEANQNAGKTRLETICKVPIRLILAGIKIVFCKPTGSISSDGRSVDVWRR